MNNKECKWYQVCPMKYYYQEGKLDEHWISEYCRNNWHKCERYKKEENNIYHPDNMLPNGKIDNRL